MEIVAIGFDAAEGIGRLAQWQDDNEMPFTFVVGPSGLTAQYSVRSQSTKFGIAPDGVITYRGEYGSSSPGAWRQRLRELAESSQG